MGYRIVYGPAEDNRRTRPASTRFRILTAFSFAAFVCMVRFLWPEGRELLTGFLLPGTPTFAQAAYYDLLENLQQGFGVVDSLTVFCREILYEIA